MRSLDAVKEHRAAFLIAHKEDRISRRIATAYRLEEDLDEVGAEILCVASPRRSKAEKMALRMVAELERDAISELTTAAMQRKKARNQRVGSIPFGFRLAVDGVHLEPCPTEHPALIRILELRREGLGGRRIAATLTIEGYRPRGASWNPGNLQTLADRTIAKSRIVGIPVFGPGVA